MEAGGLRGCPRGRLAGGLSGSLARNPARARAPSFEPQRPGLQQGAVLLQRGGEGGPFLRPGQAP